MTFLFTNELSGTSVHRRRVVVFSIVIDLVLQLLLYPCTEWSRLRTLVSFCLLVKKEQGANICCKSYNDKGTMCTNIDTLFSTVHSEKLTLYSINSLACWLGINAHGLLDGDLYLTRYNT